MAIKKTLAENKQKDSMNMDRSALFQQIEMRAYEIYLERQISNSPGDYLSDWLKAEKEIKSKHRIK